MKLRIGPLVAGGFVIAVGGYLLSEGREYARLSAIVERNERVHEMYEEKAAQARIEHDRRLAEHLAASRYVAKSGN